MAAMKTPGVYIVEKNAFPNSVVEVATAVPVFIGYTEMASNGGKELLGKPFRISSMAEFERYFGGAPQPHFTLKIVAAAAGAATPPPAAAAAAPPAPTAPGVVIAPAPATDAGAPAAPSHSAALASASIAAVPGYPDMVKARAQDTVFKRGDKQNVLERAAGKAGGRFLLHQAMRHFFQNGGGPCYIVSVGDYNSEIEAGDEKTGLISGIAPLLKEQEPTMVVVPDAVLLAKADCVLVQTEVLKHCGYEMRNRFAILDVWGGDLDRRSPVGSAIDEFRNDIGINFLDFAAAYYPWLHTSLWQANDLDYRIIDNADELAALIKDDLKLPDKAEAGDKKTEQRLAALADIGNGGAADDDAKWVVKLTAAIDASTKTDDEKAKAKAKLADPELRGAEIEPHRLLLNKTLMVMSDLFSSVMDEARAQLNLMPPAAAMAGLYTMVDNTRGVWKAPANVSVANVVKPAVEISHADQEDLNVTTQGKSINAIRSFIGEGALVWGARTLDGNSLDWRYINVRRTMIMLEESCRLAAKAMVFEPNVANTWVTIKSMISNFLTGIWKRGGLAGAVPDDAFSVHVGLGETMTPEDILEGILRVTVLVAISRPAEFIEITFQQQMQKS